MNKNNSFIGFAKTYYSVDNKTRLSYIDFNKLEIKIDAIYVALVGTLSWDIYGDVYSKDKTEKTGPFGLFRKKKKTPTHIEVEIKRSKNLYINDLDPSSAWEFMFSYEHLDVDDPNIVDGDGLNFSKVKIWTENGEEATIYGYIEADQDNYGARDVKKEPVITFNYGVNPDISQYDAKAIGTELDFRDYKGRKIEYRGDGDFDFVDAGIYLDYYPECFFVDAKINGDIFVTINETKFKFNSSNIDFLELLLRTQIDYESFNLPKPRLM